MLDYWKAHHSAIMATIIILSSSHLLPAGFSQALQILASILQPGSTN
jgi:hypothetical protein